MRKLELSERTSGSKNLINGSWLNSKEGKTVRERFDFNISEKLFTVMRANKFYEILSLTLIQTPFNFHNNLHRDF